MLALTGAFVALLAAGCGNVSENDFGQTLSFDGFFPFEETASCGSVGLAGLVVSTSPSADPTDATASNCTLDSNCLTALQVTNHASGNPIPSGGGQGATGSPVPTTGGLNILPKQIHIEYALPIGQIAPRNYVMSGVVEPLASDCRAFRILEPRDTVAMVQDPLSYPSLPFYIRARVTYEAVTAGGQDIRADGDIDLQVF